MDWWQALLLGIVQGLTEFLPVSSSGHLMIFKELLGVDSEGFLDFTLTVHLATVLSTLIVFWGVILKLFKGLFKFRYNDETDYVAKLIVSMVPVGIVGLCFRDKVEALFGDTLQTVAICLMVTALLLFLSDRLPGWIEQMRKSRAANSYPASAATRASEAEPHAKTAQTASEATPAHAQPASETRRNGISFLQAFIVGLGQACAVAPGLSRSGTTIAVGLLGGVHRDVVAQFSFLMVIVPILGEQLLDLIKGFGDGFTATVSPSALIFGFIGAFISGLFACRWMISIVRKARLSWFALYCLLAAVLIFIFA